MTAADLIADLMLVALAVALGCLLPRLARAAARHVSNTIGD